MIDRQTLDEALARHSTFAKAPPAAPTPDRRPVITEDIVKENLRRVRTSPALVTEHPDGTRSFVHPIVKEGDGIRDSLGTDRGDGSSDSIKMLREERAPHVQGLLEKPQSSSGPERDASGRFVSHRK
jgi:hypothetical protein